MLVHRTADLPATTGSFGLAQGAYGAAGNLELLVPARDGGMHVLWHNADAPGTAPSDAGGPAGRRWSGALHVPVDGAGTALVDAARITQIRNGPDALEATAVLGGIARRLHWTPAAGFVAADALATGAAAVSATAEAMDGWLHTLVVRHDGTVLHCRAEPVGYPAVHWHTDQIDLDGPVDGAELLTDAGTPVAVVRCGAALRTYRWGGAWRPFTAPGGTWSRLGPIDGGGLLVVGLDAARTVQLAHRAGDQWAPVEHPWPTLTVDDVAAAATTLDGGRLDLVMRTGDRLHHAWSEDGGAAWTEPQLLRSDVWLPPGTPVHRRAEVPASGC